MNKVYVHNVEVTPVPTSISGTNKMSVRMDVRFYVEETPNLRYSDPTDILLEALIQTSLDTSLEEVITALKTVYPEKYI